MNEKYMKNSIDLLTGKIVKSIYFYKYYYPNKGSFMIKTKRDLVWQYYRNRENLSIKEVTDKFYKSDNKVYEMRITYRGDPKVYIIKKNIIYS
jgi:hypothetical protein